MWSPGSRELRWTPDPSLELELERDWGLHADHQNPGWTFHDRHLCQGPECISVVIWYGPDASYLDIADARKLADTVELQPRSTQPVT